jgi:peptidoglycan/xylan/chitin deacetylase (PgdA/CDA1 family)
LNKKAKVISNLILVVVVSVIALIGFAPEKSVTISGEGGYQVRYGGDKAVGGVALTINVYENSEIVTEMINVLVKNGAKATFFVGGCWADDNEGVLKLIIESGFELGNHGYFHKDHKTLSESQNYNEINDCNKIIYSLTGYRVKLFAPPSGSYGKNTLKVAEKLGMQTIMWTKDTIDWRDSDKEVIFNRATKNLVSGDIILMHPKKHTLETLERIILDAKSKNLKLLTVSECLGEIC